MKDDLSPHDPESCAMVRSVLSRVGDSWSVLVILALDGMGVMRFNDLKRHLAISQRMLSLTLRGLERDGLVQRHVLPTVPPRVEYRLTDLGVSFGAPIRMMGRWALDNRRDIDRARADYDARHIV